MNCNVKGCGRGRAQNPGGKGKPLEEKGKTKEPGTEANDQIEIPDLKIVELKKK